MDIVKLQLIESLRAFIWTDKARCFLEDIEQWEALWRLSAEQKLLPIVADASLQDYKLVADEVSSAYIRKTSVGNMVGQTLRTHAFLDIYAKLADAGVKALVAKGIVCRALYTKGELRLSGDEDLLFLPQDEQTIFAILKDSGMQLIDGEAADDQVATFVDAQTGLHLELHRKLFSPSSQAYGRFNSYFEQAFERAVSVKLPGGEVWSFDESMHMLYLILHSFKHFVHSGFGIRQVADICMFAQVNGEKIDWPCLFETLQQEDIDVFAINTLQIGKEYLGFESFCPSLLKLFAEYEELLDCKDMLEDLLSGGIYGGASEERLHSSRITLDAASTREQSTSNSRFLYLAFPKKSELEGKYKYLTKQPYLLPLAWGQRMFSYLAKDKTERGDARTSIEIGERRVELLKKYRVIK